MQYIFKDTECSILGAKFFVSKASWVHLRHENRRRVQIKIMLSVKLKILNKEIIKKKGRVINYIEARDKAYDKK